MNKAEQNIMIWYNTEKINYLPKPKSEANNCGTLTKHDFLR